MVVKEAGIIRPQTVEFHSSEMSRIGKCRGLKQISQGLPGAGAGTRGVGKGVPVGTGFLQGDEQALEPDRSAGCTMLC